MFLFSCEISQIFSWTPRINLPRRNYIPLRKHRPGRQHRKRLHHSSFLHLRSRPQKRKRLQNPSFHTRIDPHEHTVPNSRPFADITIILKQRILADLHLPFISLDDRTEPDRRAPSELHIAYDGSVWSCPVAFEQLRKYSI